MRELTKTEAIELHRKLWNWIADETERRKAIVLKTDYHFEDGIPLNYCYCCDYDKHDNTSYEACSRCPINWGYRKDCGNRNSFFQKWCRCNKDEWQKAAKYARKIANLSERKFEEEK